jgi:DNA-binding SARP family transcriptional activator/tetratricopeptide (TPR) repeat protein
VDRPLYAGPVMRFRILGPLQILVSGREVGLGRSREQRVLAALLLDANRVVPLHRLVDAVWDDRPPDTAGKLVRNCVSTLRQVLADAAVIGTEPVGYVLRVAPGELDAEVFRERVARGRDRASAGDLAGAVEELRDGLALWRGTALAGLSGRVIGAAAAGLDEQRLAALEECLGYELALGRDRELVAELTALVAEHPLREPLRAHLMRALYRSGRRADALEVYRTGRRILVDELGLEPGAELRDLEREVLADAEPPSTGTTRPAQLPPATDHFTGRDRYIAELDGLRAAGAPIAVIAGAPGVGKTALAVHWAHRAREHFPDGQLHVNLRGYGGGAPLRPIDALALFLTALGGPDERVPVEVEAASARYRSLLADRRVLVVLDNAATVEQVRPLLPGGTGCLVLVTARDRLAGLVAREGARLLTLGVLSPAEARRLLGRALGEDRAAGEPEATERLAGLCARLPLALRIAAAHLTARQHRRISAYVSGLAAGDRVAALAVEGDEQAAVRSAFDLSYAALPAQARRTFRCLGLVPGPDVTAPAVAALTATGPEEAARTLDRLAGAHLVDEYADGRYTFHDLLRAYAADRSAEEDGEAERQAATQRLCDWYRQRVDAAARRLYPEILRLTPPDPTAALFPDPHAALAWLDTERANLVATAVHGPPAVAWTLSDLLRGYFHQRMCTVDWLTVARAGLAAARRDGDPEAEAAAELSLGDLHWRISRYPSAIAHYTRAAPLARRAGWLRGESAVHGNLGNVYQQSGALDRAADEYRQALATAERLGWTVGVAANLENLGAVCWESGRLDEAVGYASRAVAICRETGFRFAEGVVLTGLGEVCQALGRPGEAVEHLTRALELHREVGNRGGEAETVRVLATVRRDAGEYPAGRELAETALALARAAGDRRYEADALNTLATIQLRLGDLGGAVAGHRAALDLAREIGNRYPEVEAQLGLARAYGDLGRSDSARACARDGLTLAHATGYRYLEDAVLDRLAELDGGGSAAADDEDHRVDVRRRAERAPR